MGHSTKPRAIKPAGVQYQPSKRHQQSQRLRAVFIIPIAAVCRCPAHNQLRLFTKRFLLFYQNRSNLFLAPHHRTPGYICLKIHGRAMLGARHAKGWILKFYHGLNAGQHGCLPARPSVAARLPTGPKQLFSTGYGQLLYFIHNFATAIIALCRAGPSAYLFKHSAHGFITRGEAKFSEAISSMPCSRLLFFGNQVEYYFVAFHDGKKLFWAPAVGRQAAKIGIGGRYLAPPLFWMDGWTNFMVWPATASVRIFEKRGPKATLFHLENALLEIALIQKSVNNEWAVNAHKWRTWQFCFYRRNVLARDGGLFSSCTLT